MTRTRVQWMRSRVALACIMSLTTGVAAAAGAQSATGQAYGAYVNTPVAGQAQAPLAVLPGVTEPNGDMASASAGALDVPNALSSDFLQSTTTGAIGSSQATTQSIASVAHVNIL